MEARARIISSERSQSRAFYSVTAIFLRPSSPSQPTKKRDDPQTNYRRLPTSPPARRMSRPSPSSSYSPCSSHSSSPLPRCFVFIMAHVADSVPREQCCSHSLWAIHM